MNCLALKTSKGNMYKTFFGLNASPFEVTPDPGFLVLTEHTLDALECLLYGVQSHRGFVQLTGEVGTGKTVLLNTLMNKLQEDPSYQSAFIFNSRLNANDFMELVLAEFGIAHTSGRKVEMLRQLNRWLLERFASGGTTVLLLDEAQNLSADVLEEVRLLTNLETPTQKLLQIVLAGQPELDIKLKDSALRQLRQRITMHCKTYPLTYAETVSYIEKRLRIAGCRTPGTFSPGAMRSVSGFSQGIPRIINSLCERALIAAYVADERPVLLRTIEAAAEELKLEYDPAPIEFAPRQREASIYRVAEEGYPGGAR